MPNAELVKNRREFLPFPKEILGNMWSRANPYNETPFNKIYPNGEHSEFSLLTETARDLVQTVQTKFIQDGWHFNSIMGNDSNLHIVFINLFQGVTTKQRPPLSFIKPHLLKPETGDKTVRRRAELPTEPINEVLKAANLYAYDVSADYNSLKLPARKGLLFKHVEELIFFQSGIALVAVSFMPFANRMREIDTIQNIINETEGKPNTEEMACLAKWQAERKNLEAWLAANANPKPLF